MEYKTPLPDLSSCELPSPRMRPPSNSGPVVDVTCSPLLRPNQEHGQGRAIAGRLGQHVTGGTMKCIKLCHMIGSRESVRLNRANRAGLSHQLVYVYYSISPPL